MTIDLDHLENLHQSTTPGPWHVRTMGDGPQRFAFPGFVEAPRLRREHPHNIEILGEDQTLYPTRDADMEWIVAAHEAFPALLDELRELRARIADIEDQGREQNLIT